MRGFAPWSPKEELADQDRLTEVLDIGDHSHLAYSKISRSPKTSKPSPVSLAVR